MTTFNTSEVGNLAADLGRVPAHIVDGARAVLAKTALEVKKGMQDDISRSPHFKGVARDINYDLSGLSAEIGPEAGRGHGHQGSLAFIAAFGSANTGPSWDYAAALDREQPKFEKFMAELGEKSLGGIG